MRVRRGATVSHQIILRRYPTRFAQPLLTQASGGIAFGYDLAPQIGRFRGDGSGRALG